MGTLEREAPWPGLILRQRAPDNLEFPFSLLDGFLTSQQQFFVRNHFAVPRCDAASWRVTVEGAVERPFGISFDELTRLPSRAIAAVLECSGNSRLFLETPQKGLRWEKGAVGNAEWTGVPLGLILRRAGLKDSAREVVLVGADRGELGGLEPPTPGEMAYARSLPVAKAMRDEVILAYRMNGEKLTEAHGFPVRAVVPGWYGMASVKWLTRIVVTDEPFLGYFQTLTYSIFREKNGLPSMEPVAGGRVKAEIARPTQGEVVPARSTCRIFGAAWAGESVVTKVEISQDGGAHWAEAGFLDEETPFAWRRWEYAWRAPAEPGSYTLMARATDREGNVQPMQRDRYLRDAMVSHVQPVEITVR